MTADAPRPALGELARLATEAVEARKACVAEWARRPNGERYEEAARRFQQARAEFADACTPEAVLQLVALATGGGAGGQHEQKQDLDKTEKGQLESNSTRDAPVCMEDLAFPPGYGGHRPRTDAPRDTARLDWLTRAGHCLMYYGVGPDGEAKWDVPDWGVQPSPRAAIDLAMREDSDAR